MTIEIREFDRTRRDEWDRYVERSEDASLFHQYRALELQAEHSDSTLHPLVGFKNEHPIGLYPVFEIRKGPVRTAFSPPPDIRVPYLGPVMLDTDPIKRRKLERRRHQFIEGCTNWVEREISPTYSHTRIGDHYSDMRMFQWDGFVVTPRYTYNVDLTPDEDDLLLSFSRNARRNIRGCGEEMENISVGGRTDLEEILSVVEGRYEEQDIAFGVPPEFVCDLYDELPEGQIRPYVYRVDGEFVSGIIAIHYGDTVSRWMGGVRTNQSDRASVNDLLDWRIMCDAKREGRVRYDLVGANTRRLNRYKAKYNPELVTVYQIERGSLPARTAAHLYKSRLSSGLTMLTKPHRVVDPGQRLASVVPALTAVYKNDTLSGDLFSRDNSQDNR
ncbi:MULTISPECIES: GNAT family N-acetyltransferase [Haloferax]|uniref:GNAT family N-acetyltransferase n=1 Tax=Haloferax marinum TaxID=2666143 RepID=A0A6A8GAL4_9EURY|nr:MULTISPECIES: GNAT family N-acetyltransferase [Haloferax]KAB1191223.1 GNAT family N-acetyltransferase [Haloferax sp. CBA1150]MRW98114.1 GNAT family N-acetyltransferase [Haloferax marinum]